MKPASEDHQCLAEFVKSGSDRAFRRLVEKYTDLVHSMALRRTGQRDLADDITQAVFIVLAKKAKSIRPGQSISAWLFTVTRYAAIDALRREAARKRHEKKASAMDHIEDETGACAEWEEVQGHLEVAMDGLGGREREAVLLRYYENQTLDQVAKQQGTSTSTVHRRIGRALEKMRRHMARKQVILPVTVLSTYMGAHAVQAAPVGLSAGITPLLIASGKGTAGLAGSVAIAKGAMTAMMNMHLKITAAVLLLFGTSAVAVQQTTSAVLKKQLAPPQEQYELAWSDEFDGEALDRGNWHYRADAKLKSVQLPENVSVADGQLVLNLTKLDSEVQGKRYAGAGVVSEESFKYGYYEVRAKLGDGVDSDGDGDGKIDEGWHHAFWCLRAKDDGQGNIPTTKTDEDNNDANTEIDGFEIDPGKPGELSQHVILWEDGKTIGRLPRVGADRVRLKGYKASEWHTYSFLWTEGMVKFYVDDKLTHTVEYPADQYPQTEVNVWLSAIATNWFDKTPENSEARYDYFRYYRLK